MSRAPLHSGRSVARLFWGRAVASLPLAGMAVYHAGGSAGWSILACVICRREFNDENGRLGMIVGRR